MYYIHTTVHLKILIVNIVSVIKSRRLRRPGHVARMEEGRNALKMLTDTPARKRPLGNGRTILEWILKKMGISTRN